MQRGVDYEPLREALKEEDFLKADDIHRKKLIEVAGEAAQERGWVYFSEVRLRWVLSLLPLLLLHTGDHKQPSLLHEGAHQVFF